jgi:tRNA(Ile)-lysidine synthase
MQLNSASDKNPAIKISDYCLRRYREQLHLTPVFDNVEHWQQHVAINKLTTAECEVTIALPNSIGSIVASQPEQIRQKIRKQASEAPDVILLRAPLVDEKVSIRFSHDNPKCQPSYRDKSRSLKKVLQEAHIPTWQRQRLPLIYYNDVLVAVMGVFACKHHCLSPNTPDQPIIKLVWLDAG